MTTPLHPNLWLTVAVEENPTDPRGVILKARSGFGCLAIRPQNFWDLRGESYRISLQSPCCGLRLQALDLNTHVCIKCPKVRHRIPPASQELRSTKVTRDCVLILPPHWRTFMVELAGKAIDPLMAPLALGLLETALGTFLGEQKWVGAKIGHVFTLDLVAPSL